MNTNSKQPLSTNSNRAPRTMYSAAFTVAELLIVIVVISILAAIVIVTYRGIQNSAYDSAVSSDLVNLANKYELFKVDSPAGTYPYNTSIPNIPISQSAYDPTVKYNLINCTNSAAQGSDYAMLAVSKSGAQLWIGSGMKSVQQYTGGTPWGELTSCATVLDSSTASGAGYTRSGGWRAWTMSGS